MASHLARNRKDDMFYAYILQSLTHPAEHYRGSTRDLRQRLVDHNAGKCSHTSKFKPWKIKFYAAFETEQLAREFERYLKTGSGHAFADRRLGIRTLMRIDHVTVSPRI